MSRYNTRIILLGLMVLLAPVLAADDYNIKWQVLGGGGTKCDFPNGNKLSGTAVQTAIGDVQTPSHTIVQGFWNKTIAPCRRGDADGNGNSTISDAVYIINFVFANGPEPVTTCGGDADGNGYVNISDAVWLIQLIFFH